LSIPRLISRYQIGRVGLLNVDIGSGKYDLFADSDLYWLDLVDQVALKVHLDYSDAASLLETIRRHGFAIELQDNDRDQFDVTSPPRISLLYPSINPQRLSEIIIAD
jgi:hypothetical protein